jgi:type II secretory pathway pseudopilin PulG
MWFRSISIKKNNDGIVLIFAVVVLAIISVMAASLLVTTFGEKKIIGKDKLNIDLKNGAMAAITMAMEEMGYDVIAVGQYNFTNLLTTNAQSWHVTNRDATLLYNPQLQAYETIFSDPKVAGLFVRTYIKDNDIFINNSTNISERDSLATPNYDLLIDRDNKILVMGKASKGSYRKEVLALVKLQNRASQYALFADDNITLGASAYFVTTGAKASIRANRVNIDFSAGTTSTNIGGDLYALGTITVKAGSTYGTLWPSYAQMLMDPVSSPSVKVDALKYCNYIQQTLPSSEKIYYLNGSTQLCYDVSTKTSCNNTTTTISCATAGWSYNVPQTRWEKSSANTSAIFFSNSLLRVAGVMGSASNPWEATLVAVENINIASTGVVMRPHRYGKNFLMITDNKDGTLNYDIFLTGAATDPNPQFGRGRPGIILSGDDVWIQGDVKVRGIIVAMEDIEVSANRTLRIEYNGRLDPFPQEVLNNLTTPIHFDTELFLSIQKIVETYREPL